MISRENLANIATILKFVHMYQGIQLIMRSLSVLRKILQIVLKLLELFSAYCVHGINICKTALICIKVCVLALFAVALFLFIFLSFFLPPLPSPSLPPTYLHVLPSFLPPSPPCPSSSERWGWVVWPSNHPPHLGSFSRLSIYTSLIPPSNLRELTSNIKNDRVCVCVGPQASPGNRRHTSVRSLVLSLC